MTGPGRQQGNGVEYAQVALDTPVRREFSYVVPESWRGRVRIGARVVVPFGPRRMLGIVVGVVDHAPEGVDPTRIRPLQRVLDEEPLLTPALLRLGRRMADTAFCSWGQALAAMLPAALRTDRPRRTIPTVELAREIGEEERAELERRFPKQAKAVAWLERAGGPVVVRDFLSRTGLSRSPLDSLARKGLVRFGRKTEVLDPFAGVAPERSGPLQATPDQQRAVDEIVSALDRRRHADFLLYGITGSGKTEVYLQALARCVEQGRGAIVLVPEIALTPQTVARFRARFGEVAVLHSGLTDAERHDQWQALRRGEVRIVVGARSALFAPIPDLGLIVVDEEHETSFKQESVPRYHARDVARERARLEHAVCVLGSATPSLESWAASERSEVRRLELPERVAGGRLPEVRVVDMRTEKADRGHWLVVSRPLEEAVRAALARGEKAILFLNRRGFAPAWHCRACGTVPKCPRCAVSLTYHRWRRKAMCHACLAEYPPPDRCAECGQPVHLVGVGTERAEDTLHRLFPEARIARMDRDTMVRRESYEEVFRAFSAGEVDLLLGTQMVAKGLDFPDVTVVGVLDADTALHHPDFRAAERCFDLIAQVSGRAGRSSRGGLVVVQTWLPEHPAIQSAVHHDYRGFARRELAERALYRWPPAARAFRVTCESPREERAERLAAEAAELLREAARRQAFLQGEAAVEGDASAPRFAPRSDGVEVLGPAPPPVALLRGRHRRQVLVKCPPDGPVPVQAELETLCQKEGIQVDPL